MSKVVVFGTGRGADVAHRYLSADSEHEVVAFAVDEKYLDTSEFKGLPVVAFEGVEDVYPPDDFNMYALLGYQDLNGLRKERFQMGKEKGYSFVSYISSDFFRIEDIEAGENCFILDNQSINLDVKIGNNVVMWSSNHIGDLTVVEDNVWISSHCTIAANVVVGDSSFIGIGATVSNQVSMGARGFVGANALVTDDAAEGSVFVAGESGPVKGTDSKTFVKIMEMTGKL